MESLCTANGAIFINLRLEDSDRLVKFLSNNIDEQQKYIFLGPEKYVEHNYYINDKIFDLKNQSPKQVCHKTILNLRCIPPKQYQKIFL